MKELRKNALRLGLIGMALGVGVSILFLLPHGSEGFAEGWSSGELAVYFIVSALHGALAMGSSAVYGIEEWSILRCTLTHFLITMCSFYAAGFAVWGFSSLKAGTLLIMTALFILAYFIIWLVQYLKYRHEVKILNQELREWKCRHSDAQNAPKEK